MSFLEKMDWPARRTSKTPPLDGTRMAWDTEAWNRVRISPTTRVAWSKYPQAMQYSISTADFAMVVGSFLPNRDIRWG